MSKKILLWATAVIVTLAFVVFQRATGPTNAVKATIVINNKECKVKFPRSVTTDQTEITFNTDGQIKQGTLYWRDHNSQKAFEPIAFEITGDSNLAVAIPNKERLDKIDYYITLNDTTIFAQQPLVLRYKDSVPAVWLIAHIVLMFCSMLFAVYGLFMCFGKGQRVKRYLKLTIWTLLLGGLIFGAVVQKFAFGVYWSGFPFGNDITDNKTLIALLALLAVLPLRNKTYFRYFVIVSYLIMLVVYCIPHSMS
ncbi:MAG: hypothetical protein LBO06_05635 [Bacteroidales bacterium]|jgi:hypothetical protein|nr:hypothetical protein [Bacteroidales bacterium]